MRSNCTHCAAAGTDGHRRRGLLGLAGLGLLLVACGRSGDGAVAVAPLEIGPGTTCALDGMTLADYGGPKAQIHYADQGAPMFLCDTVEMFNQLLRPEQLRKVVAVYVQDMGRADWERPLGHWIDARGAWYVRGSRRHGSMGPTFAAFAQEADARRFAGEHGGQVMRFGDVTLQMVDLGGGADFEARM